MGKTQNEIQGRQFIGAEGSIEKSIYSLYQLFTIIKITNYRCLEFTSSFGDHSGGKKNPTKAISPIVEKIRSYRELNFLQNMTFPNTYGKEIIAAGLTI